MGRAANAPGEVMPSRKTLVEVMLGVLLIPLAYYLDHSHRLVSHSSSLSLTLHPFVFMSRASGRLIYFNGLAWAISSLGVTNKDGSRDRENIGSCNGER